MVSVREVDVPKKDCFIQKRHFFRSVAGLEVCRRRVTLGRALPPLKEWRSFSRFPCTAQQYYDLMLDGSFQQKLHTTAMKMGCYDVSDDVRPDGTIKRIVFSEPRLNLPTVLARVMKKAQAYHENAVFNPTKLERRVEVIPCMGHEMMDFSFHEWVRPDSDGVGGCVVESVITLHVKGGWLARMLERFIKSTSKVKILERDGHMNSYFRKQGVETFDVTVFSKHRSCEKDDNEKENQNEPASTVIVTFGDTTSNDKGFGAVKPQKSSPVALAASLAALCSHPLAPMPKRRGASFKW